MTKVEWSHLQITKNNQLWEVTLDEAMLNWPGNFFEASLLLTPIFSFHSATDAWQVIIFHFRTWMKLSEVEIMEIVVENFYKGISPLTP